MHDIKQVSVGSPDSLLNLLRQLLEHGADLHELKVDAKDRAIYMQAPTEDKMLALHAKLMLIDKEKVFIGSANFDPRSLRMNTETGLLIHSEELAQQVHKPGSMPHKSKTVTHHPGRRVLNT